MVSGPVCLCGCAVDVRMCLDVLQGQTHTLLYILVDLLVFYLFFVPVLVLQLSDTRASVPCSCVGVLQGQTHNSYYLIVDVCLFLSVLCVRVLVLQLCDERVSVPVLLYLGVSQHCYWAQHTHHVSVPC